MRVVQMSAYGIHVTEWHLGISVMRTSDIDICGYLHFDRSSLYSDIPSIHRHGSVKRER